MKPMHIALFLFASCAFAAPSSPAVAQASKVELLPAPKGALEFPQDAKEVTLAWLLDELARLTGQELTMAVDVRSALERAIEPLELTTPVPAGEVYGFVEALLVQREVFLAQLKGGQRPVLGVFASDQRNASNPRCPVVVTGPRLDELAGHPALLCQIVLTFENIDSRQLQTQLRQLLVDQTGMQQVVPCGERSLLLQGSGAYLLGLSRLLREVDQASAARPAPPMGENHPQPAAGPQPPTKLQQAGEPR